jgi:hypothetical protein
MYLDNRGRLDLRFVPVCCAVRLQAPVLLAQPVERDEGPLVQE